MDESAMRSFYVLFCVSTRSQLVDVYMMKWKRAFRVVAGVSKRRLCPVSCVQ